VAKWLVLRFPREGNKTEQKSSFCLAVPESASCSELEALRGLVQLPSFSLFLWQRFLRVALSPLRVPRVRQFEYAVKESTLESVSATFRISIIHDENNGKSLQVKSIEREASFSVFSLYLRALARDLNRLSAFSKLELAVESPWLYFHGSVSPREGGVLLAA